MPNDPEWIARSGTESAQQQAQFAWFNMCAFAGPKAADDVASYNIKGVAQRYRAETAITPAMQALHWIHAIPNGGSRGDTKRSAQLNGAIMKAEGVKPGVHDVFLPVCRHGYAGLYFENKVGRNKLSEQQKEFAEFAKNNGYVVDICYNWKEAVDLVCRYLGIER